MRICDFTTRELDMFRKECNFTDIEMQCFNLKAKNKTNIELSMELNICDSTVSTTMKSVRQKITAVIEERSKKQKGTNSDNMHPAMAYFMEFFTTLLENSPLIPESHTTKEWAEMPDKVSIKNKWYAVSDYRTDNDISVPRFKFGDGVTLISKLPFVTAAITDNDVRLWDLQMQIAENKKKAKKKQ